MSANILLIGSLHTARFALEQGKDVLAVPGNVTSPLSAGTNNLIKSGAVPVTSTDDVLHVLNLKPAIIDLLSKDISDGAELLVQSGLEVGEFGQS